MTPIHLTLKSARAQTGLSQAEVARRIGVTRQRICQLESTGSNPTLETLERLSKALGMTLLVSLGDYGNYGEPGHWTRKRSTL